MSPREPRHDVKARKKIADLYAGGLETPAIKARFGISEFILGKILDEHGVPRRGHGPVSMQTRAYRRTTTAAAGEP